VLFFLPPQFAVEKIAQKVAARGESKRELLGAADSFRCDGEESPQQSGHRLDAIIARPFRFAFEIVREGDDFAPVDLAVLDPDELQIVGEQDVVRQRLVAGDLIRLENLIEVFADGLVLDIAEDHRRLHNLEIRRARAAHLFCFVDDADAWTSGLGRLVQQSF
jgi:hypothetical protein